MAKNLLLLAISCLVAALLAELVARIFLPEWAPRTGTVTQFWQFDSNYGWAHVPNAKGRFASFGFDTLVTTNSAGFRGKEISKQKDPSATRVLVLGDSYVWGFGVQDEDVFTRQIEARCPRVETVNLGVSGYSTDQELLLYREKGVAYGADIVVLVVAANDYEDNARSKVYVYYYKPIFVLEGDRLVLTNRPVPRMNIIVRTLAQIAQQSYVLTQLNRSIEAVVRSYGAKAENQAQKVAGGAKDAVTHPAPYPRTTGQAVTVRLIRELASSVTAAGSQFVVVLTDGQGANARELAKAVAVPSISYVYVDELFRPDDMRMHLPGDFHWNAEGHAVVAQALTRSLMESGKLREDACSPSAVRVSTLNP